MTDYDVIIAGAGPAGAQCARYIAQNSRYSVLLLEKSAKLGDPNKSTGGTELDVLRKFDLPEKIVQCRTDSIIFEGPAEQTKIPIGMCVLDFGKLKTFLAEDAVKMNVELRKSASVQTPLIENGKVVGVQYADANGVQSARGKIIIDATGPTSILATKLGLRVIDPKTHWVGMEFEMDGLNLPCQNAIVLKFDHDYAPGGYSWIFSIGKNKAKVGNCWMPEFYKKNNGKGSNLEYLKKWISEDPRLRNGKIGVMHGGDAFFGDIRKRSTDNFMAIGDAVCSIHPVLAEGIRYAMSSGQFAAETAINALNVNDASASRLYAYDKKWAEMGKYHKIGLFVTHRTYSIPNNRFDAFVRNFRKFDAEGLRRLMDYEFTLMDIIRMTPWL